VTITRCDRSVNLVLMVLLLAASSASVYSAQVTAAELRIAVFDVDVSPPIGSPVAYAPTRKIVDPLSARGIVLLGAGRPIVLCAVDYIGIANGGNLAWREALAEAAETTS